MVFPRSPGASTGGRLYHEGKCFNVYVMPVASTGHKKVGALSKTNNIPNEGSQCAMGQRKGD